MPDKTLSHLYQNAIFRILPTPKHYTPEFKQQIVDLYHAEGTSYLQLERKYGVNRSTLSSWVKQAFEESKQRYGAVKTCRSLNDNGTPCSLKRVQRHMAAQGLRSVVVKKYPCFEGRLDVSGFRHGLVQP